MPTKSEIKMELDELKADLYATKKAHHRELQARDDLIELLKDKVKQLQKTVEESSKRRGSSRSVSPALSEPESQPVEDGENVQPGDDRDSRYREAHQSTSGRRKLRLTLPSLPLFTGDETDVDAFTRWLRKFRRHAELEDWTEQEKLAQLELHLTGRAERLYEVLPADVRESFELALAALHSRLVPVQREALLSAQLMRRRQKADESVESYAQDFEALFERSYGRRPGMDDESKELLRRDLFVQGLRFKWQEKVLPSAETFADALHQARAAEEQEKQLHRLHREVHPTAPAKKSESVAQQQPRSGQPSVSSGPRLKDRTERGGQPGMRCYQCGDPRHKARNCPNKQTETPAQSGVKQVSATSTAATPAAAAEQPPPSAAEQQPPSERLDDRCQRLREEWTAAEFQRMTQAYRTTAGVDAVSGCTGPLYYTKVEIEGVPVEAMVDSGSSATIMSFQLFQQVGKQAKLSSGRLQPPGAILRDYSHNPILIGAQAELTLIWKGKSITTTVYIRSDPESSGEPCLLGTNVVIPLGLMTPAPGVVPRGETRNFQEPETNPAEIPSRNVVQLVRSQRVPPRSSVVVQAQIDGMSLSKELIIEPSQQLQRDTGLVLEDSLVCAEDGGLTQLVVSNPTPETKQLTPNTVLGSAESGISLEQAIQPGSHTSETKCGVAAVVSSAQEMPTLASDESRREQLRSTINIVNTDLAEEEKEQIRACILAADDVFALDDSERGEVEAVEHSIDTGQSVPVHQPPRRVPFALRSKISQMVQNMLSSRVVQESRSPWSSPVVIVPKSDGSLRFCVDYRRLNALTRKDVFPLPRIDDLLDQLHEKRIFSTLDARTGYWQIRMSADSQAKTAFSTTDGLYEFRVMPFGLCNAPATFQRLMQHTLRGLGGDHPFCSAYIDDIVVFSSSLEEHIEHLNQVFQRLRDVGLKLHPKKCHFARQQVLYLGHIISAKGIYPNPEKVKAVQQFKTPTNVRAVREFLGIAGYYRRFIHQFAKIAAPLHLLTRQDTPFVWSPDCEASFCQLKEKLVTSPVLVYPNFSGPFILSTDASAAGLGAVLEQQGEDGALHPVAYASRTISKHERNYCITELEALGVVWAVRHFRAYLLGHHCTVYTDHSPVKAMLTAKHPSGRLARWSLTLAEFDLEILYRPGKQNSHADALSRSPMPLQEGTIQQLLETPDASSAPVLSQVNQDEAPSESCRAIEALQREDPDLQPLVHFLESGELPADEKLAKRLVLRGPQFSLVDGVLYFIDARLGHRQRLVVPKAYQQTLMAEIHSGACSGHFAAKSLYATLSRLYWWDGMHSDVHHFCRQCLTCASYDGSGRRSRPPLQPIPVGGPFQRLGVDILEMPLTAQGNRYIVVFIDYLTKWAEACAIPDQTSETIARLLVDNVVCRHGVPEELLSDRGPNLLSSLIHDVCDLLGMHKINTTAYHPQCDGLVENLNKTLRAMIAKHTRDFGVEWDQYLQHLLFAYRSKPHATTGESPFYLIYGRDPRLPTATALSHPSNPYQVDLEDYRTELTTGLSEAWTTAQQQVKAAQAKQKYQYDKRSKESKYQPGDRVMVLMPQEQTGKNRKLALPYHGPYRVLEALPCGLKLRPVDQPTAQPILVNLDRVTRCSPELPDVSWLGKRSRQRCQHNFPTQTRSGTPRRSPRLQEGGDVTPGPEQP